MAHNKKQETQKHETIKQEPKETGNKRNRKIPTLNWKQETEDQDRIQEIGTYRNKNQKTKKQITAKQKHD